MRGYSSFPFEDEIHYGDKREYVEQFNELLRKAVGDRLRTPRAAVLMSGGLDSSSVAATACEVFRESGGCDLQVFTYVYVVASYFTQSLCPVLPGPEKPVG